MLNTNIRGAQTGSFIIPANGRIEINSAGEFVRCLEASDIFYVSINNSGSEMYFTAGIEWTTPALETYQTLVLINKTAAPITVIMAWGFGEYKDGRLTASGNLTVVNAPADKLDVDDADTQTALAALQAQTTAEFLALTNLLKNDQLKRSSLTPLGASAAGCNNVASATLVTPAANANGLIIRNYTVYTASGVGALFADTAAPATAYDVTKRCLANNAGLGAVSGKDIYVPAGIGLYSASSAASTGTGCTLTYELL